MRLLKNIMLPIQSSKDFSAFDNNAPILNAADSLSSSTVKLKKIITKNVIRAAINRNKSYIFSNLLDAIPGLQSIDNFMDMLGNIELIITGDQVSVYHPSQEQKLYIMEKLLAFIEKDIVSIREKCYGSDKFKAYPIKEIFSDKILRKYVINHAGQAEAGKSQKTVSETQYYEDLDNLKWYAYDDNFGTNEDKLLVKALKELMPELESK